MPSFTPAEIEQLGNISLDLHLKNKPVDQIARERPLLSRLMAERKSFAGGKEYITEQVRKSYDSNFGWYGGDDEVTYNRKDTVRQARFEWMSAHDGYSLNEDLLLANGITLTDKAGPANNTGADMVQLTNLFDENNETLRLGFEEQFDYELHLDGSQDSKSLAGLDHLIATSPATGVVGGIDRDPNSWWRNQAQTGVSGANQIPYLHQMYRKCTLNGGAPNFMIAGENWIDSFQTQAASTISRYAVLNTNGEQVKFDPSVAGAGIETGLAFKGVPILWDPTFEVLDAALSPSPTWSKRCYLINTKHMKLRPASGHDMIARKPPRSANRYVYYWGLTWKGAITINRGNCHGVQVIS